ncbi:hypothetical protein [uncultured Methylobacterium sp.]|nr:hypothetical protein [uncultured Methylobacterium sp.]
MSFAGFVSNCFGLIDVTELFPTRGFASWSFGSLPTVAQIRGGGWDSP